MGATNKPIVLLQLRDVPESLERERQAVLRTTQLPQDMILPIDVLGGDSLLPALTGAAGLIIGGSGYSVFENYPRHDELVECVVEAREIGLPMFGICFGIQLIAHAFGGRVVRDEPNRERGTFDIHLTNAGRMDPLFAGLPTSFPAHCSHHDAVVELPEDARLLASSERCRVHAFVMPGRIYGVQFHPERSRGEMERIFIHRENELANTDDQLSPGATLRDAVAASGIMRRFVEIIS
jgi:GMP synthase (glutamine-hydrolysing)